MFPASARAARTSARKSSSCRSGLIMAAIEVWEVIGFWRPNPTLNSGCQPKIKPVHWRNRAGAASCADATRLLRWVGVRKYDLNLATAAFLGSLVLFFGAFLIYPLGLVLKGAFIADNRFSFKYFEMLLSSPLQRQSLLNSFQLAALTTGFTTLLALPLAQVMGRFDFRGKALLNGLLLVPMILPPFVGAIGLKQLLARFGSLNLFLVKLGLLAPDRPIDWLGEGGLGGIVILQVLNLYPIMFLNVSAAMASIDPALREAAQNLGATGWRLFRTITLPLILPGYFAGAIIVFIWAFTDLGTPLIFGYSRVVPVQIFDSVNDLKTNTMGYTLVVFVLVLTVALFVVSKHVLARKRYEMIARGHTAGAETRATRRQALLIWGAVLGLIVVALLPHLAVIVESFSERWFFSIAPTEWTPKHFSELFHRGLTASSLRNSLFYSSLSALLD